MPSAKKKQELLAALSHYVLDNGLNTASLRPMALAAGTSDRMLIYHFGSKDNLIAEVLDHLARGLASGLDQALPETRFDSETDLIETVIVMMRSDGFAPYMRVWHDIVSASAQGEAEHAAAGHRVIGVFLDWIARRHPGGDVGAAFALTLIEGILVMDSVGQSETADKALRILRSRE